MGMKTGLVIGFGAGYVLGSRAGRQRYEEIQAWWSRFSGSPAVQRAADNAKSMAGDAGRKSLEAVQGGVSKVTDAVKTRLGDDDASTSYASGT
jgi:hypothetical protein